MNKIAKPKHTTNTAPAFDPVVFIPSIRVRLPDGSLTVKAGQPLILNGEDEINSAEAARILGCEVDWVGKLCDRGTLIENADWRRIGVRGNYKIKRASVLKMAGYNLEPAAPFAKR